MATTMQGGSSNTSTTSSIRMVPHQSQTETIVTASGALMPEAATSSSHNAYRDGGTLPLSRKSITVTRTLDVESAHSSPEPAPKLSNRDDIMPASNHIQGASPSSNNALQPSTSIGSLLPTIPKMSAIDLSRPTNAPTHPPPSRPSTAPTTEDQQHHLAPPPPAPRLPPFMQSKRWARMCEAPLSRPKSSNHERVVSEEDRPMTLREASFEQQRAIWKTAAPTVSDSKPGPIPERSTPATPPRPQQVTDPSPRKPNRSSPVRPDDVSSILTTQGLCRPLSLPTWQIVRASRATRTSSQSAGNIFFRKLTLHRTGTTRHRRQQSSEKNAPRPSNSTSQRSQIGRKRASSDLRKKANVSTPQHRRGTSRGRAPKAIHGADGLSSSQIRTMMNNSKKRSTSPVPSLHDPEKAKRFSEECEEMLSNTNFEKDFISPSVPVSRSATDASLKPSGVVAKAVARLETTATRQDTEGAVAEQSASIDHEVLSAPHDTPHNTQHQQQQQAPTSVPSRTSSRPTPPQRISSRNAAAGRIATAIQLTKPSCMPILNGFSSGAMVTSDDVSEQLPAQHLTIPQTGPQLQTMRIPLRMASNASTATYTDLDSPNNTMKTGRRGRPRGAVSTDTLMLIEGYVQQQGSPLQAHAPMPAAPQQQTSLVERLKAKTGFGSSASTPTAASKKQLPGTPGLPPERPLPDLPAEDASVSSRKPAAGLVRGASTSSAATKRGSAISDVTAFAAEGASATQRPVASKANSKNLSIKALEPERTEADPSGSVLLPTPSSVYSQSQASVISEMSSSSKPRFVRHDKSQFRAERIKDLKRRYKAEMDRDRRISEEGEDDDTTDHGAVEIVRNKAKGKKAEVVRIYRDNDGLLPPLPLSLPNLREIPSLDQLDQFPQVPASRPGSRASRNSVGGGSSKRTQSRNRSISHARQSSKASSRYSVSYRQHAMPRVLTTNVVVPHKQVLATSQIRVLVDTDPVTGGFRAGAISPDFASSICSSREGSPTKSHRSNNSSRTALAKRGARMYLQQPLPLRIDENGDSYVAEQASITDGSPVRRRNDGKDGGKNRSTSPTKKTSIRSGRSHASGSGHRSAGGSRQSQRHYLSLRHGKHRRMSFETYASLDSSPSPSSDEEDEAEAPLLPHSVSVSSTAERLAASDSVSNSKLSEGKRRKIRRRWNSNDIRTVQLLYEYVEDYHQQVMAQERELQRQQEEIKKMVRVIAPMSRARGLRPVETDEEVLPLSVSDGTAATSNAPSTAMTRISTHGSPSRVRGPYVHAYSHSHSSSKAQLDVAVAGLESVMRERGHLPADAAERGERPVSNVSSLSATTQASHGSGVSTASSAKLGPAKSSADDDLGQRSKEGSMTDPREYDLDLDAVEDKQEKTKGHTKAVSASAPPAELPRPKSRGALSIRSFRSMRKNKKASEAGSAGPASPIVNLHRPPPIPRRIKREVLSEEEDGYLSMASIGGSTPDLLSGVMPDGVVRKEGYLRLPGISDATANRSTEKLEGDSATPSRPDGEMGLSEVRRGLGLVDDDVSEGQQIQTQQELLKPDIFGSQASENKRLSVNHAFTRTEAWDQMLESFA